jgi:signal transduction histidine kinase
MTLTLARRGTVVDVTARASWVGRLPVAPLLVDALLGAVLLVLVVVQVWLDVRATGLARDDARYLMFAPAVTLPLAWRRLAPLATIAVISASVVVQSLVAPGAAFGEFLAVMLATYSVAAHTNTAGAVLGLVAVAPAVIVQNVRETGELSPFELVYGVVYFGGAWLLGRAVRRRREHAAGLVKRTELLERDREERARVAVAAERSRMARELHDVIAHSVSVIVVQAGAAEEICERDPDKARQALRSIRTAGNDALTEMRRLLGILRSDGDELTLEPQPGLGRLDELVRQAAAAGLRVQLDMSGPPRALPPGLDLTAYRVVQEALTNVRKHAGTADARVHVRYLPDELDLRISDDGAGPTPSSENGHGLLGMRERVELYGGTLVARSRASGGFEVSARLPLQPPGNSA